MTYADSSRSLLAVLCLPLALVACGGSPPSDGTAAPVTLAAGNPVDPATAGVITGTVTLTGPAPAPAPINMSSDPYCMEQGGGVTQAVVLGPGGTLGNVFVYVRDGLGDLVFPIPQAPVVLDQRRCMYAPRVFGIQAGQSLEIRNSDSTLHNIHARPEVNREFNRGQGSAGMTHTHVFTAPEVMVPFKCDVHKWMNAWVGVLNHPFHAVSTAEGTFSLTGLPPGTYTIEAWHETLGTQRQTVTLGARATQRIAFSFPA